MAISAVTPPKATPNLPGTVLGALLGRNGPASWLSGLSWMGTGTSLWNLYAKASSARPVAAASAKVKAPHAALSPQPREDDGTRTRGKTENNIRFRFDNLPPDARVSTRASGTAFHIDTGTGIGTGRGRPTRLGTAQPKASPFDGAASEVAAHAAVAAGMAGTAAHAGAVGQTGTKGRQQTSNGIKTSRAEGPVLSEPAKGESLGDWLSQGWHALQDVHSWGFGGGLSFDIGLGKDMSQSGQVGVISGVYGSASKRTAGHFTALNVGYSGNLLNESAGYPKANMQGGKTNNFSWGAAVGTGKNFWLSNAKNADEIKDNFDVKSYTVIGVNVQVASSGPVWVVSAGLQGGLSYAHYTTNTFILSDWSRSGKPPPR